LNLYPANAGFSFSCSYYVSLMLFALRPLNIRLKVAYMATAYLDMVGAKVHWCEPGSSWSRHTGSFVHPYTALWQSVENFYNSQELDKLCDAEILDRFNAAIAVGFKTVDGRQVTATQVQKASKLWNDRGWFRYEHQHASRMRVAKRVGLLSLALVGVPMISDL